MKSFDNCFSYKYAHTCWKFGDDAIVPEQENVAQVEWAARKTQQKVLSSMGSEQRHLIIQGQLREGRYVLGPFNQHQELLLHRITDISDAGDFSIRDLIFNTGDLQK